MIGYTFYLLSFFLHFVSIVLLLQTRPRAEKAGGKSLGCFIGWR